MISVDGAEAMGPGPGTVRSPQSFNDVDRMRPFGFFKVRRGDRSRADTSRVDTESSGSTEGCLM